MQGLQGYPRLDPRDVAQALGDGRRYHDEEEEEDCTRMTENQVGNLD